MDTSIGENEPLTLQHCQWLGLKNENGALVRKGMKGEVQYFAGKFHYCEGNKTTKTLHTRKDLNDIVIPIANAEIAERNRNTYHNNCRDEIKNGMSETERRNAANSFGPNWANILSGLGDQ